MNFKVRIVLFILGLIRSDILKKNNRSKIELFYEILINIISVYIVFVIVMKFTGVVKMDSSKEFKNIEVGIYIIFVIDYFCRFFYATDKKEYIKENIFNLIAIIPFSSIFRIFRTVRCMRLIRKTRFAKRFLDFINTNSFIYVFFITITLIILGAYGIYYFELGITLDSFSDALWLALVTVTTVGYGDCVPVTGGGRFVASILMIVGIGFLGMLTGTISTYFMKKRTIFNSKQRNIDLSNFTDEEVREIYNYIEFVKSKR